MSKSRALVVLVAVVLVVGIAGAAATYLFFLRPQAPIVLSVEDNGTIEFQLFFSR
jgi:hypothetical protein